MANATIWVLQTYVSLPISTLFPSSSQSLLVLDTSTSPSLPTAPRLGDANLDGFPDLLLITGTNSDRTRKAHLILSESCGGSGVLGCNVDGARRGWKEVKKDVGDFDTVADARGVAFLDMDEDVSDHVVPGMALVSH